MANRAPKSNLASRAPATVTFRRYLRLDDLRSGAPDLILGCVTEGGSLAGKLSASSRSSCFCLSLSEFSCFGFLSALVFAFAVMVLSLEAVGRATKERTRLATVPSAAHAGRMLTLGFAVPLKAGSASGTSAFKAR